MRTHATEISKPALLALCVENSPVAGEFPAQRVSNARKASMWWRHNASIWKPCCWITWPPVKLRIRRITFNSRLNGYNYLCHKLYTDFSWHMFVNESHGEVTWWIFWIPNPKVRIGFGVKKYNITVVARSYRIYTPLSTLYRITTGEYEKRKSWHFTNHFLCI